MPVKNLQEQLRDFRNLLAGQKRDPNSPAFRVTLDWLRNFKLDLKDGERLEMRNLICHCFSITPAQLDAALQNGSIENASTEQKALREQFDSARQNAQKLEDELDRLLPKRGFIRRYVEFTRVSEAPLAYHVFCAALGIGAVVNRRVWFDMGIYRLFPATGVIILGPSGIKKTSAGNIIVNMLQDLQLVKVYSEKLTPEALIDSMRGEQAVGLIYAPEMSVFLNKAKYMEGFVQLITRFMDCPDKWTSGTIMRGDRVLHDVAISSLMCSTPEWFVNSIPEDSFSGGFIPRNLLVVQYASPRIEPHPQPRDPQEHKHLVEDLALLHTIEGQCFFDQPTENFYTEWYHTTKVNRNAMAHDILASYFERKPDHVKRMAIVLHLAEHGTLTVCLACFERALAIIEWTEKFLPPLLDELFKSETGSDQALVLRKLRESGGRIAHWELVQRLQYKFSATQIRAIIGSLREANMLYVEKDNVSMFYVLKE